LQQTLRYDNSVNVRLAALEALSRYGKRPDVSRTLVDALSTEKSPMVQVALIDTLVDLHNSNAVEPLKRLQQSPDVNPTVREHAAQGVRQLS
jgi:HEAT repeat protein